MEFAMNEKLQAAHGKKPGVIEYLVWLLGTALL